MSSYPDLTTTVAITSNRMLQCDLSLRIAECCTFLSTFSATSAIYPVILSSLLTSMHSTVSRAADICYQLMWSGNQYASIHVRTTHPGLGAVTGAHIAGTGTSLYKWFYLNRLNRYTRLS